MKLSNTYTNTITFQINKVNVPETAVIFDDADKTLRISLKSHGFNLLKYYFKTPKIDIDFSQNMAKTDKHYVWNNKSAFLDIQSQLKETVDVVRISPDTLLFKYDVNAIKKVPVKINTKINYAIGYDILDKFKIVPDSIKIIGPEILVSAVNYIETDTLKLQGVKKDIKTTIALKLPENIKQLSFSASKVEVEAKVTKFTEGKLKIPVTVINIPENINLKYYPKKISVYYYTSLENYKTISASDFQIVCDFAEVSQNQSFLIPRITKQPDVLRRVKINHDQIEYIITE
ncbi:YbbR-like domain-containing protein [Bizionia argentinensis JUB59]|uniref:YbbR-like domain-containing protein n=2 Tax=Bizionia TaxID=283785 RepID=G2EGQ1_9FLAO|nr:YbbR-like domain-containing protein [Bizionia argentinensis JUB59]